MGATVDFSDYKFRCHALGKIATKPRYKNETLSRTTMTYLKELHMAEVWGRQKHFTNKFVEKGLMVEEASITLYSRVKGELFLKNTERLTNDYFTGEPDNKDGLIRDIKSSWELSTFPMYETEIPNSGYSDQLDGYMDLSGYDKAELIYCLVDTPFKLVDDELRRQNWKHDIFDHEGNVRDTMIEMVVDSIKDMIYTEQGLKDYCLQSPSVQLEWFDSFREMPEWMRVKVFEKQRDDARIEFLKGQVDLCRQVMNGFSEELAKQIPVTFKAA